MNNIAVITRKVKEKGDFDDDKHLASDKMFGSAKMN
jgi:hypothetical protein